MTPLQLCKNLIDGLVSRREGVLGLWIRERGWPVLPENQGKNDLLARLTSAQREVVAGIAAQARDGGIHDTLAYLQDEICLGDLRLAWRGVELPVNPFATELHYDWVARCDGAEWPDERPATTPPGNA